MSPLAGLERDADVVLAVREAVGPEPRIMVDANFGYDGRLDLLEDFIRETLPANLFWMEEMVTADLSDYRVLRRTRDRLGSKSIASLRRSGYGAAQPCISKLGRVEPDRRIPAGHSSCRILTLAGFGEMAETNRRNSSTS